MMKQGMPVLLFLLITATYGFSPEKSNSLADCKARVIKYYQKMNIGNLPGKGKCYYMNISTQTTYLDENNTYATGNNTVKLYLTNTHYHYISDPVTVYQDQQDMFVVVKSQGSSSIFWNNAVKSNELIASVSQTVQFRDSLLTLSTVVSCRQEGDMNKIVLSVPAHIQSASKIAKITCWMNETSETLKKLDIEYVAGHSISKQLIVYNEVNFNYAQKINEPVKKLIFDKNNRLLSKYNGYQLINNREQQN